MCPPTAGPNQTYCIRRDAGCLVAQIRTLPATRVAHMRYVGPYGSPDITAMWQRFRSWCDERRLLFPQRPMMFGIAQDNPNITERNQTRYDVCSPTCVQRSKFTRGTLPSTLTPGRSPAYCACPFGAIERAPNFSDAHGGDADGRAVAEVRGAAEGMRDAIDGAAGGPIDGHHGYAPYTQQQEPLQMRESESLWKMAVSSNLLSGSMRR